MLKIATYFVITVEFFVIGKKKFLLLLLAVILSLCLQLVEPIGLISSLLSTL